MTSAELELEVWADLLADPDVSLKSSDCNRVIYLMTCGDRTPLADDVIRLVIPPSRTKGGPRSG